MRGAAGEPGAPGLEALAAPSPAAGQSGAEAIEQPVRAAPPSAAVLWQRCQIIIPSEAIDFLFWKFVMFWKLTCFPTCPGKLYPAKFQATKPLLLGWEAGAMFEALTLVSAHSKVDCEGVSTLQMVASILQEWLHRDVFRQLSTKGYRLAYVQDTRAEIDLTVKSLSVDLRSGLRLCRLTELLAGRESEAMGHFTAVCSMTVRSIDKQG